MASNEVQEIHYRPLTEHDFSGFISLWDEAFKSDPYAFRTTSDKWDQRSLDEKNRSFHSFIKSPNFIFGAFIGTELVGMVGIQSQDQRFVLWGTFVKKSVRGKNIGHQLISEAVRFLTSPQSGIDHIILEVFHESKSALALYGTIGFREVSQSANISVLRLSLRDFKMIP